MILLKPLILFFNTPLMGTGEGQVASCIKSQILYINWCFLEDRHSWVGVCRVRNKRLCVWCRVNTRCDPLSVSFSFLIVPNLVFCLKRCSIFAEFIGWLFRGKETCAWINLNLYLDFTTVLWRSPTLSCTIAL